MIYAVRAYAPAESFKKDFKMLRVRQEFECVNSLGQESNSQAVKEGGLMSIRDDESEGSVGIFHTTRRFICLLPPVFLSVFS